MNYLLFVVAACLFALWIVGLIIGATHWLLWLTFIVGVISLFFAFVKEVPTYRSPGRPEPPVRAMP